VSSGSGWTWTYDTLPYPSRANPRTAPDLLASLATVCGMSPAPVTTARVLEIGCSDGGNIIPMGFEMPDATFVGIDASFREIDEGRATIAEIGVRNVELRAVDLMTVGAELGEFDYIIAHGVYSWVHPEVQQRLLAVYREHLAPQGVGYISYNVHPGWHVRETVREMMLYHTRKMQDPREKTSHARGFLDFLVNTVSASNDVFLALLKRAQTDLNDLADAHFFHDMLEESNRPLYFHEFVERLDRAGLAYVTEAEYWTTQLTSVPEAVADVVRRVTTTAVEREQYLDFWRNRGFRQSIVRRADATVSPSDPLDLTRFLVSSSLLPGDPQTGDREETQRFVSPGGIMLQTEHEVIKAGLRHLGEIYPRAIPFAELLAEARRAAGLPDGDAHPLEDTVRSCFTNNLVELHTFMPHFVSTVSERPLASPVSRSQARMKRRIPSMLHKTVDLDDPIAHILVQHLDGRNDHDALHAILMREAASGELEIKEGPNPVTDPAKLAPILREALEKHLQNLVKHALLIA
jgi:SAM-dependent methyltransferase